MKFSNRVRRHLSKTIGSISDTEDPSLENWRRNWATGRGASSKRLLCDLLSRVIISQPWRVRDALESARGSSFER